MDKNKYYLVAALLAAAGAGAYLLSNGSDESPMPAPGEVSALAPEDPNEPTIGIKVGVYGSEEEEPLDEPVKEDAATTESLDKEPVVQIQPMSNRDVLELTADDVVQVMRKAGSSDVQIYEHGPAVRDGMAGSGAVQIKIDDTVNAVFAANGDSVYISTRTRGHFIYNVKTGWQNSQEN